MYSKIECCLRIILTQTRSFFALSAVPATLSTRVSICMRLKTCCRGKGFTRRTQHRHARRRLTASRRTQPFTDFHFLSLSNDFSWIVEQSCKDTPRNLHYFCPQHGSSFKSFDIRRVGQDESSIPRCARVV